MERQRPAAAATILRQADPSARGLRSLHTHAAGAQPLSGSSTMPKPQANEPLASDIAVSPHGLIWSATVDLALSDNEEGVWRAHLYCADLRTRIRLKHPAQKPALIVFVLRHLPALLSPKDVSMAYTLSE